MKGNMVVTVGTGKLGSMVGYRITNSNDKEKQGLRAYVAHPSNPQSFLQAQQRMKIANIARIYGALKPVIRRAFETEKYGGMSYLKFLKLNFGITNNVPYVPKYHLTFIPGAFMMSQGSLPSIGVKAIASATGVTTNLNGYSGQAPATNGQLAQKLLDANPRLQAGDQLTFVAIHDDENDAYTPVVFSFVLDPEDTGTSLLTEISKGYIDAGNGLQITVEGANVEFIYDAETGNYTVAGCVIQSRDGGDAHLRSTEYLEVLTSGSGSIASWLTPEAKLEAIRSFMAAGADIDWPTEALV